jgi:hypothetical protein
VLPAALLVLLCDTGIVSGEADISDESLVIKVNLRFQTRASIDRRIDFGGVVIRFLKTICTVSNRDIE